MRKLNTALQSSFKVFFLRKDWALLYGWNLCFGDIIGTPERSFRQACNGALGCIEVDAGHGTAQEDNTTIRSTTSWSKDAPSQVRTSYRTGASQEPTSEVTMSL